MDGGSVNGDDVHTEDLEREIDDLKEALRIEQSKKKDVTLSGTVSKDEDEFLPLTCNLKPRRVLKGHRGRVLHFDWSNDKNHLLSAGQDGFAVVWNTLAGHKEISIQTTSPWVTACSYAPSTTIVACGGMDSQCSIYKLTARKLSSLEEKVGRITHPSKMMAQHTKYITHCEFLGSDQQLLTSSADTTCALWDLEMTDPVQTFRGHKKEVLGLATHPREPSNIFASGSLDKSSRVWDVRTGRCEVKFENMDAEVNAIRFMAAGEMLAVAGSDGIVHLYDLRSDHKVKMYSKASIFFGATSVDFSKCGQIMFVGYEDYTLRAWDVLRGSCINMWLTHQDRISHVLLSPDGTCLGSSSWDGTVRIFAV